MAVKVLLCKDEEQLLAFEKVLHVVWPSMHSRVTTILSHTGAEKGSCSTTRETKRRQHEHASKVGHNCLTAGPAFGCCERPCGRTQGADVNVQLHVCGTSTAGDGCA